MFFTSNLSGYGADRLIGDGVDTTRVRKIMQTIGFLGPSVFLVITIFTTTALTATICVTCGLGLHAFSHAGVYCNHQDISSGKSVAGVLLGLSNTGSSRALLVCISTVPRENLDCIELTFLFHSLERRRCFCPRFSCLRPGGFRRSHRWLGGGL